MSRLFDPGPGLTPEVDDLHAVKVSRSGARPDYTKRAKALLALGRHPATRLALLADSTATCGDCAHATLIEHNARRWWKCAKHRLGMSHSEASDIRVGWPACLLFTAAPRIEVGL